MGVVTERVTAEIEGDFVLFLIGMRINKVWRPDKWLPVFLAMPRMLKELGRIDIQDSQAAFRLIHRFPSLWDGSEWDGDQAVRVE
jgi:hypothetical protein